MSSLNDPEVKKLLDAPNHAALSTINADGSVHNTMVWVNEENGALAVNSSDQMAIGFSARGDSP